MLKKLKGLPILFVLISVFLAGCGDSSQLKKGEKFVQEKSKYNIRKGQSTIEVINNDQWKYRDENNGESVIYNVEETEYKHGNYKVVKITNSNKYSKQDPWVIRTGKYMVIGKSDNGFSLVKVGRVVREDLDDWEYGNSGHDKGRNFQKDYEEAKDKEAFLKDIVDHANLRYTKITGKEEGI